MAQQSWVKPDAGPLEWAVDSDAARSSFHSEHPQTTARANAPPASSREETERVTVRVEHDLDVLLRLVLVHPRPALHRPRGGLIEIIDP